MADALGVFKESALLELPGVFSRDRVQACLCVSVLVHLKEVSGHMEIREAKGWFEIQICETHFPKITHFDNESLLRPEDEGTSELCDESCHISKVGYYSDTPLLLVCINESG